MQIPALLMYELYGAPGQVQVLVYALKTNEGLHSHLEEASDVSPVPFLPNKVPQEKHFVFASTIELVKGQTQSFLFLSKMNVSLH